MPLLVNRKPITAAQLQAELKSLQNDIIEKSTDQIVDALENLLKRLRAKSANRGRGRYASLYNNPFKNVAIRIVKRPFGNTIFVNSDLFEALDQGVKARKSNKYMTFPVYSGNLTVPNRFTLSSKVKVADKPRWVKTKSVAAVPPRNYYETVQRIAFTKKRIARSKRGILSEPITKDLVTITIERG